MLAIRKILHQFESGQEVEVKVWFEETKKTEVRTLVLGSPPPLKDGPASLEPPEIK